MAMKKFNIKKILIPLDFSKTSLLALEHGAYMAFFFKADITLFHVIRLNSAIYSMGNMPVPIDIMKYQEESASQKLDELAQKIRHEYNVQVETVCKSGFVCSTIISEAEKCNADLIIMGTHGVSGFTERFLGSNAYRVVNDSSCPVLTVQTHAKRKGFKDILLPIDNSLYTLQKINHAIELANHYGSNIHILGLYHKDDEAEMNKLKIKIKQIEEYIDKNGDITGKQIRSSKQIMRGVNYAKIVMTYTDEIEPDLIIIMTEWEEDLTGLFIGPFARQIVNHSKIPVMSIRPEVKPELVENGMSWMVQH